MFCYSYDEERFEGNCETREDALIEALDMYSDEDIVYTGVLKKITVEDIIVKPNDFIDTLDENLFEIIGELDYCEERVFNKITGPQVNDLKAFLVSAVEDWFEENNIDFDEYQVIDIKEHHRDLKENCNKCGTPLLHSFVTGGMIYCPFCHIIYESVNGEVREKYKS